MQIKTNLTLSTEERVANFDLLLLLDGDNTDCVDNKEPLFNLIQRSNVGVILKLALTQPLFNSICDHQELLSYWNDIWSYCLTNQSFNYDSPEISSFNKVKASFLYEQYIKNNNDAELALDFLKESAKLNYLPAINLLCENYLKTLQKEFSSSIMNELNQMLDLAKEHHSSDHSLYPVYMKLYSIVKVNYGETHAASYRHLAELAREKESDNSAVNQINFL